MLFTFSHEHAFVEPGGVQDQRRCPRCNALQIMGMHQANNIILIVRDLLIYTHVYIYIYTCTYLTIMNITYMPNSGRVHTANPLHKHAHACSCTRILKHVRAQAPAHGNASTLASTYGCARTQPPAKKCTQPCGHTGKCKNADQQRINRQDASTRFAKVWRSFSVWHQCVHGPLRSS